MNRHTTAPNGKRVRVVLHDGTNFIDRFIEKRSRYYVFEARGRISVERIKSFAIARGKVCLAN